jgi:uncharacterized membrane protein YeaQ/YmgE (transglycosylase-associated protein family)
LMRGFFMAAWFIHIVMCALIGWAASLVMRSDKKHSVAMNIGAGLAGAWAAGLIIGGGLISREPGIWTLLAAFGGAILVVGATNFFRKGRIR